MTKKNLMMRIASVLLIAVILTTSVIGGTLAKYTSDVTVNAQATIAKWDIEVNDTQIAVTTTPPVITFDLFDAAYELNAENRVLEDEVDNDIDSTGVLIAPGCGGLKKMVIENLSEVNAAYSIDFSLTNTAATLPLEFSLDNTAWVGSIDSLDLSNVAIAMKTGSATVTLYWRWVFGDPSNNEKDTALGIAARDSSEEFKVTAEITVSQVD